jgi:uncharacterized protein with von Willebrand factor type A (vWA) domain
MDQRIGGIIQAYQQYDPLSFPSPTQPPPDFVSAAFEHQLMYGSYRELTEEELARAVRLDPREIAGLGPSLDMLRAILEERKRKILETYETNTVQREAQRVYHKAARRVDVPGGIHKLFRRAIDEQQIRDLERLWYRLEDQTGPAAGGLMQVIQRLTEKIQIEQLAAKYAFIGREALTVEQALQVKEELQRIDELLKQLVEAAKTAQIGVIDMELLGEFAEPGDLEKLEGLRQAIESYVREQAERQGLEQTGKDGGFRLTPKAYRLFQGKLLERIFADLQASRSGRHPEDVVGEGAVELQRTKDYEFGDSLANLDLPQTVINALIRQGGTTPLQLRGDDIVVHQTRNHPRCATAVIMDMSGSMAYGGQYIHVKRMALALQGLINTQFPGDILRFIEMYSVAKLRRPGEIVNLMPKPVTIRDPWVRLRADLSRPDITEAQLPPHFTNIQHALRLARQHLVATDTPNRQIILITDGLPTAHFEGPQLYLLYPPDRQTEEATLREGRMCEREGITINIFLMSSWSQSEEDIRFAHRLAEGSKGRVFFTAGRDLDRYVIWDYVKHRREILG